MFDLSEDWVWDFWFCDDGEQYHMFFLHAPLSRDPEERHHRASIGHAVSRDLVEWTRVPDAISRSAPGGFDDLATWTGSVVRADDGTWIMFYTGATLDGGVAVQRIGVATSQDLMTWEKSTANPVLEADAQWYEKAADAAWHDEAFRDPWVYRDPHGDGWHMLITARGRDGDAFGRGVVGHARSRDLLTWTLEPPLSTPSPHGFGQLEVLQVAEVDGRAVLLFSCAQEHASQHQRRAHPQGAVWAVSAPSVTGPFAIDQAYPLTDASLYVGRLLRTREGQWRFFAFHHTDAEGAFIGGVSDPMPVAWEGDRLVVGERARASAAPDGTGGAVD